MPHSPFIITFLVLSTIRPKLFGAVKTAAQSSRSNLPTEYRDFSLWYREFIDQDVPSESAWSDAERRFEQHSKAAILQVDLASPFYPKWLRAIIDPPPVLFVRGSLDSFMRLRGVAVVGTRDTSTAGLEIARRIGAHFAEEGWAIISGLAIGIDAASHRGALDAKGKTVAVLANGLHEATPKTNARLADEILANGGLWLSEHPIGTPARKEFFVARNRIQTGLSAGSIIVEAALRSGSMAQANFCLREKRSLFAVLPQSAANPLKLNCVGTQDMVLRLRATPILSKDDYPAVSALLKETASRLDE